MEYKKFSEDEMQVKEISRNFRGAKVPVFNFPVSPKEEWRMMALEKKPLWLNTGVEVTSFYPDIIPDNRARGFVNDGGARISDEEKGGKDMFGVSWTYVPVAGGSMETPGVPSLLDDIDEWKEKLVWPDVDSWDWEGSAKKNEEFLKTDKFVYMPLLNGFGFERLISFMGFENAAMALVDEDYEDDVKELFDKLSDLYVKIIGKCCDYFAVDGFMIHDDWGTQRAPFFSVETGHNLFVPYMKKVTDYIHSRGKVAELHSCGCSELQAVNFADAGWDIWSPMQDINDTPMLYDTLGDQMAFGIKADTWDASRETEEQIRAKARAFVERFCSDPNKTCIVNRYSGEMLQGVYAEELYRASRKLYSR